MKKSTFLKFLTLLIICVFAFSLNACDSFEDLADVDEDSYPVSVILTYDTAGGKMPSGVKLSKSYAQNKALTASPTPIKDGYEFIGWFNGDTEVSFPFIIKESMTLTAKWEEITYKNTISLKLNGGAFANNDEATTSYEAGDQITFLPTPIKDGYEFIGWFLGNEEVALPYTVENSAIFVAKWKEIIDEEKTHATISLDLNGGAYNEDLALSTSYELGTVIASIPSPNFEGYNFLGWFSGENEVVFPYTVTKTDTLQAKWEKIIIKTNVYFDANGGSLPNGAEDSFEAIVGEQLGNLPKPTKLGGEFLGWYLDGDSTQKVDRKTIATETDLYLVALWKPYGEIVMVEFILASDEEINKDFTHFDALKGERLADYLASMPIASRHSHRFIGWFDSDDNQYSLSSQINGNLTLFPKWEKVFLCLDQTENHQWGVWLEDTTVSCTTPTQMQRICNSCGHREFNILEDALGHNFGAWQTAVDGSTVNRSRKCTRCQETEVQPLKNIAYETFQAPTIDGECYGANEYAGTLLNGDYTDTKISGKGTSAVDVTLTAKKSTYIDIFSVTGYGGSTYTVTVTYSNGTTKSLGMGTFGSTCVFEVKAEIVKVEIYMANPSEGSDFWSELSAYVIE